MSFQNLLDDLQALSDEREASLAKALPAEAGDDDKVAAAAAASGIKPENGDGDADDYSDNPEDDDGDEDDLDDDEMMGKSFMYDAHGNRVQAIDATDMLKSLAARVEKNEQEASSALGMAVDLLKSQQAQLESQGSLIKSLVDQVKALGSKGAGRASVLTVSEKPQIGTLAKSEPAGLSPNEFMAKALDAQKAGRITGRDVSLAEGYLQKGMAVPESITSRVFAAS